VSSSIVSNGNDDRGDTVVAGAPAQPARSC
jgi:hypothetical protein